MNPLTQSDCPALLTLRMYWSRVRVKFLYKIVSDLPGERDLGRLFRRIIQHRLVKLGLGRAMTVDSPCRFDPEPPLAPRELTKRGGDPHRDRGGSARGAPRSSRRARGRPAEGP